MAFLYQKYKNKMMTTGAPDLGAPANPIAIALVDGNLYTPDEVNDEFLSDVAGIFSHTGSPDLANPSVVGDVFDADDKTLTAVAAAGGTTANYILIYENTGTPANSQLLALLESGDVPGLPITPNDNDITVRWDDGANKIFRIGDQA